MFTFILISATPTHTHRQTHTYTQQHWRVVFNLYLRVGSDVQADGLEGCVICVVAVQWEVILLVQMLMRGFSRGRKDEVDVDTSKKHAWTLQNFQTNLQLVNTAAKRKNLHQVHRKQFTQNNNHLHRTNYCNQDFKHTTYTHTVKIYHSQLEQFNHCLWYKIFESHTKIANGKYNTNTKINQYQRRCKQYLFVKISVKQLYIHH